MWRDNYIAVDWGTTNRRAWLVDSEGRVSAEFADALGLMSVPPNGFESAVADIRAKLGDYPMLLAGMVGSEKGWRQAPYIQCPVDARMLADNILWVEKHRTGIVRGVCQVEGRADVMRGEEVQVLGALAKASLSPDAYICHPGTHTKWIRLRHGKIDSFQTMMTGEIFNLLKSESILSAQMETEVTADSAFQAGLDENRAGIPLLSALFAVRANYLLAREINTGASFASGLLIGSDVQAGISHAHPGEKIAIVGRADLCRLYEIAIQQAGFECERIEGEQAFQTGIRSITQHIPTGQLH